MKGSFKNKLQFNLQCVMQLNSLHNVLISPKNGHYGFEKFLSSEFFQFRIFQLFEITKITDTSYLHFTDASSSFFHRSNSSGGLIMCKLTDFFIIQALNATRRLRNSFTCTRLIFNESATIPVVYTSSSFKYVRFRACSYKSRTQSRVIK